ncbi:uncharacterized protein ACOB8E_025211 isoform 3-T3 [Sarcophilus harrisii]
MSSGILTISSQTRNVFGISGVTDLPGCGRGFLPGGVGAPGVGPEGPVQGRNAGKLPEPGLVGVPSFQTRCDLLLGAREGALGGRGRNPEVSRFQD